MDWPVFMKIKADLLVGLHVVYYIVTIIIRKTDMQSFMLFQVVLDQRRPN